MKRLHDSYFPHPDVAHISSIPRIYYGFAITPFQFLAYAKKHNLSPFKRSKDEQDSLGWGCARLGTIVHLTKKLKIQLIGCIAAFNRPVGMIALFTNHSMDWYYKDGIREKKLLNIIKEELELAQDAKAMWCYSIADTQDFQEISPTPQRPNRLPFCMPAKRKSKATERARKSRKTYAEASTSTEENELTQDPGRTPTMTNTLLPSVSRLEL